MELGRLDTAWGVDGDAELLLDDPQDSLGGVLDDASGWPADVLAFARRGSEIDQIRKDAQSHPTRGRLRTPQVAGRLGGVRQPTKRCAGHAAARRRRRRRRPGPPPDTPSSTNGRGRRRQLKGELRPRSGILK